MSVVSGSKAHAGTGGLDQLSSLSQISATLNAADQLHSILDKAAGKLSFEDDIPVLDQQPDLNDILNEDQSSAPTLDELGISDIVQGELEEEDTSLVASFEPQTQVTQVASSSDNTEGAILKQTVLKGIANQLTQATTHSEAGLPTTLAANGKYYAVGTSHGLALVFDAQEQLKCVLSPYIKGTNTDMGVYGAVSSVDLSADGTRMLVGHSKGLITHWDLTTNKVLRFMEDLHPPGFGVLSVKFTDDPNLVVFSNTGGNAFQIKFKRTITRSWATECIFSGCHGEALTFEPLLLENREESPLRDHSIIALATVTQVLVISLAPELKGLISLPLRGKPQCLPQLAWHHVVIEHRSSSTRKKYSTIDPVLAAARGNKIHYIQYYNSKTGPNFRLLRKLEVNFDIASFRWINAYTVVAMDTTERIHLLSVKTDSEIEVLDLKQVELVYNSSFFKSIETGGNVSKALMVASEHACYSSVLSYQNRLLLLGLKAVHVVTIKTWKEVLMIPLDRMFGSCVKTLLVALYKFSMERRLGRLVREGRFVEALQLGLELYEGKAHAVVGLSGTPKQKKERVSEQVIDILQAYMDIGVMLQKPSSSSERQLRAHYKTLVHWAFDACLRIHRSDLLFGNIYDTFSCEDNLSKAVFLEYLCKYIKDNKIRTFRAVVAKDFIEHYTHLGEYQLLETCILQLNPKCLDIHKVVEMCWSQQLYDAMIHVYNAGMEDYVTPLTELLLQLRAALKKGKPLPDGYLKIGYKLLVYIRCTLAGLAYPKGTIPAKTVLKAKQDVLQIVLNPVNVHNPSDKATYPHIRTLLDFDTREFLNVISLAFEEEDFDNPDIGSLGIPQRQEVVDVLLTVMVHDKDSSFSPSQVGSLFTFLARQGAKYRGRGGIRVDEHVYDQVLDYITHADEDLVNEEREQALLELWNAGVLKKFDEEKLLVKAESARFYRLCELLYEKKRQFGKVLSCYLRDKLRMQQSFAYIHAVMNEDQYTQPDREELTSAVLQNIQVLVETDVRGTARLVLLDFPLELAEVSYKLQPDPAKQFNFLQGVFDPKSQSKQEIAPPSHVVERYLQLLCRYQPEAVYTFLKTNDNYRLEEALEACSKARILDATSYLLERSGDITGAFKLILETFSTELESLSNAYCFEDEVDSEMVRRVDKVEGILQALLQFCQRNSSKLEEKAGQVMWFPTFDKIRNLQKTYGQSPNHRINEMYNSMISGLLNSMLGYIDLRDILQMIMQDGNFQFKDTKQLIMGMLDSYNYEETLLKTTNHILIHDVRGSMSNLRALVQRGISPYTQRCVICTRHAESLANGTKDDVVVFSCGHLYHATCIGVNSQSGQSPNVSCVVCNKTSAPRIASRIQTQSPGASRGLSGSHKKTRDEIVLEPAQEANLKHFRASYHGRREKEASVGLRLAPPKL